ncbi:NO-associated protein 1, chloroplastic/mitochondrial [Porphyridium purpureum]|uniref:NO-associated protein 1, chloroplastic/mitochondrial n=1 Tax=Porphyridium purpureum TaxID=35688 RepID=A0A5J4Z584_PORPP|nr:NO-associated protein 1, chloroplastic/mitochondrial [Porphyridium purpureum]|eukprot:POR4204..scf295_1
MAGAAGFVHALGTGIEREAGVLRGGCWTPGRCGRRALAGRKAERKLVVVVHAAYSSRPRGGGQGGNQQNSRPKFKAQGQKGTGKGARAGKNAKDEGANGHLDEFGNMKPGQLLRFQPSRSGKESHNVVVLGKLNPRKDVKLCFGCGAYIGDLSGGKSIEATTTDSTRPYRYHQLDDLELCPRCQGLEDASFDEAREAVGNVDVRIFENQLRTLKWKKVLIVVVVDATDPVGSFIPWQKMSTIVGTNPIFIALTKCDLLPKVTRTMLDDWQQLAMRQYGDNVLKVFPISGLTGSGVFRLARSVYKFTEAAERQIYVIGAANIGKSTLSRALADCFFRHIEFTDPRGWGRKKAFGRLMPTVSSLPGTTLMSIRLPCLDSPNHAVWDTPGLIPQPVPWLRNRLSLQHPLPMEPEKFKLIEGTCLVIGYPNHQVVRIEIERSSPDVPVWDFRLALWQAPVEIDLPVRVMKTADARAEGGEGSVGSGSETVQQSDTEDAEDAEDVVRARTRLGDDERDRLRTITISPNTSFKPQDLLLGGLGWIAMNGKSAAEVTIYIRATERIEAVLRNAVYDPYRSMKSIRTMDPFEGFYKKGDPLEYDFSRQGAIEFERQREDVIFNIDAVKKLEAKTAPRRRIPETINGVEVVVEGYSIVSGENEDDEDELDIDFESSAEAKKRAQYKPKKVKDLWEGWVEGGIRNRSGAVKGIILS